ncbi:MAG TPA: recombinase family protein [Verrucomicrobiae bacterium]|nr:recombinase family protein [Verrucomicrobiae bacterium]
MKENSAPKKRVGIWIRVSTEDQAQGESPEHHEHRGREYAKFNNWTVSEVYDLAGVSGKTVMEHSEAKRMLSDLKRGHISGLIFSKLARLARNTRELLDFADFFREHNADMISLQEKIDTSTPAGRLFYTMIAAMAQWEREETVDRVKASIAVRAKLGSSLGGPAPFGYEWKDRKLVIHSKEAPVRKLMFDLFLKHRRKKTVVRLLNDAGHRTRNGSCFTSKTVTRLLQDPIAKGVHRGNYTTRNGQGKGWSVKPESEWVLHEVEGIVSAEVWEQCNQLIGDSLSKQKRPAKRPVHVFAGVTECKCGEKMYVPSNSPKYICRACRNKIAIADLDAIFCEEIKAFSISPDAIAAHLNDANLVTLEKQRLLAVQEEDLQRLGKEIKRTYDLYQQEKLDADGFSKFYAPLEERRKQLESAIPALQAEVDVLKVQNVSAAEVAAQASNLYDHWQIMQPSEKREIVEIITEKIVVDKDEIAINLYSRDFCKDMANRWRKGWDSNPR